MSLDGDELTAICDDSVSSENAQFYSLSQGLICYIIFSSTEVKWNTSLQNAAIKNNNFKYLLGLLSLRKSKKKCVIVALVAWSWLGVLLKHCHIVGETFMICFHSCLCEWNQFIIESVHWCWDSSKASEPSDIISIHMTDFMVIFTLKHEPVYLMVWPRLPGWKVYFVMSAHIHCCTKNGF